jgi:hypothetical protein
MTGFNPNPRATSSGWGAPPRSGQAPGTSGWGSSGTDGTGWGSSGTDGPGWGNSGADGTGWGSSANNNGSPSGGWSNEPGTSGEQPSSQWGTQAAELGISGDGWGSAGTDPGPGWGETSNSDQGNRLSSATAVANMANPDALFGGTGADDNPDATTPSSSAVPSIPTSGELNVTHNEERGEDTVTPTMV